MNSIEEICVSLMFHLGIFLIAAGTVSREWKPISCTPETGFFIVRGPTEIDAAVILYREWLFSGFLSSNVATAIQFNNNIHYSLLIISTHPSQAWDANMWVRVLNFPAVVEQNTFAVTATSLDGSLRWYQKHLHWDDGWPQTNNMLDAATYSSHLFHLALEKCVKSWDRRDHLKMCCDLDNSGLGHPGEYGSIIFLLNTSPVLV